LGRGLIPERSAHRNVKELAADILDWAATWNENPRPFGWSKSAVQILERLASYCVAINAVARSGFTAPHLCGN
jgi:hypothetical protein